MSANGLQRLVSEEGLRLEPYNDSAGHATVGVGHLIHHGPFTNGDVAQFAGLTKQGALKLLAEDVRPRERAVEQARDRDAEPERVRRARLARLQHRRGRVRELDRAAQAQRW